MPEKPVAKKRQPKVAELSKLCNQDPDVRLGVRNVLAREGAYSLGDLAARKPKVFDALHSAMIDLVEEAPREVRPGFLS